MLLFSLKTPLVSQNIANGLSKPVSVKRAHCDVSYSICKGASKISDHYLYTTRQEKETLASGNKQSIKLK